MLHLLFLMTMSGIQVDMLGTRQIKSTACKLK